MKLNIKISQVSKFGRRSKEVLNKLTTKTILRNPNQIYSSIPPSIIFSKLTERLLKNNQNIYSNNFEKDLERVTNKYLKSFLSVGAYTDAIGNRLCIENIEKSLFTRDEVKYNEKNEKVFLGVDTAKEFENICLSLINDDQCGVLISSLQEPVFFDIVNKNKKGTVINFDNTFDFGETFENIKESIIKNKNKGVISKILVLSNPNNFSGSVYTYQEIQKWLEFCFENNLLLIVDESFQNILTGGKFFSFRKVLLEHENKELSNNLELISLFDNSKGLFPQPSIQGCFSVLNNMDPFVLSMYVKFKNCMICMPTIGQIVTDLNFSLFHNNTIFSEESYNIHLKEIENNKKLISDNYINLKMNLEDLKDLEVYESLGGYHLWTKIKNEKYFFDKYGKDFDVIISDELLKKCGIRVIPGSMVGIPGFLRFSKLDKLEKIQFDYLKDTIANL